MKNQLIAARNGKITKAVAHVADSEGISPVILSSYIAEGKVAILASNRHRGVTPKGVGKGLSMKVNANIGTSPERADIKRSLKWQGTPGLIQ